MRSKDFKKIGQLREVLEKEPHSFGELMASLNIPKASLARYLADLRGLGDISKAPDGKWASMRNLNADLRFYSSERELKDARAHTKSLMENVMRLRWAGMGIIHVPSDDWQEALQPEFFGWIHLLVEWGLSVPDKPDLIRLSVPQFVQHLRTGYRREFWAYLEEYAELQKKYGFPRKIKDSSPLPLGPPDSYYLEDLENLKEAVLAAKERPGMVWGGRSDRGDFPSTHPSELAGFDEFAQGQIPSGSDRNALISITSEKKEADALVEELNRVPKKDVARARELLNMMVGQLVKIVVESKDQIPLKGLCDSCPRGKIRVKEER
jgi:hypothetical protein